MSSASSSTKSVSFEAPRNTTTQAKYGPTLAYKGPSNFCIKKGTWYDCLRPVPGYKQFGGMGADIDFTSVDYDVTRQGEEESWCDEGDRTDRRTSKTSKKSSKSS